MGEVIPQHTRKSKNLSIKVYYGTGNMTMASVLSIAGSDPSGGAGLQADLAVFHALGLHGMAVPTALTVQCTARVSGLIALPPGAVEAQLEALLADLTPHALKTGMLHTAGNVLAVARAMREFGLRNLVIDPVARSTSGAGLLSAEGIAAMRERLIPLATVVTPNLAEAALLAGMDVPGAAEMERAARAILGMGARAVVVTGGHLEGSAMDLYVDADGTHALEAPKAAGEYHGTGCVFSAAIAGYLGLGHGTLRAVELAKQFVGRAIAGAHRPGKGMHLLRI